jgi:hypothetical protein
MNERLKILRERFAVWKAEKPKPEPVKPRGPRKKYVYKQKYRSPEDRGRTAIYTATNGRRRTKHDPAPALELLAQGLGFREVGRRLGLRHSTVRSIALSQKALSENKNLVSKK